MSLYGLFNESRLNGPIGQIESPRFYPPRLTPEQCQEFSWIEFKKGLQPFVVLSMGAETEMALVDKTSLWSPGDICGFVGGKREIVTLADLTIEEGVQYLYVLREMAMKLQNIGNVHWDQYANVNVAFGFNPEDYQLGAHSISRMHAHIFIPNHWLSEGEEGFAGLRHDISWQDLSWFDRLKFIEPFNVIYYDFIQHWRVQNPDSINLLGYPIEHKSGYIYFDLINNDSFPAFFSTFQLLFFAMKEEYKKIEHIFTQREVDPQTKRFLRRDPKDREDLLEQYVAQSDWLSIRSISILKHLSRYIRNAHSRDQKTISSSDQVWITKGFAGTFMFAFDRSETIRLYFFPRVITTSAPEKGVCGIDRPTNIIRTESKPPPYQNFENEKFLLAAMTAAASIDNQAYELNFQLKTKQVQLR